ncbi:MAG: D-alanyl-D-alanine carboxypeptidase [Alphaproteobacteria bacterium]|nr:D-alanyl-D-alanine carboxypeptidase [Alphaproteobacteria bacterium]
MKRLFAFLTVFLPFAAVAQTPPNINAPQAILIDFDSGRVLFERNSLVPAAPSSMSKILTAYLVFEKLREGKITLDQEFVVGPEAWRSARRMNANRGSTMFLEYGERVSVEDLLRGLIINSGNDAAVVLAENISGSEANFVALMNRLAQRLGLEGTTIMNTTGWYEKDHLMSPKDLAILSRALIMNFPEFYTIYSEREFLYKPHITGNKDNRNKLLWIMPGADGIKTGHTTKGGYALASSIKRGDRRLIAIINGLRGNNPSLARFEESRLLLNWGFREFANYVYFEAGAEIIRIPVRFGRESSVAATVNSDVLTTARANAAPSVEINVGYKTPVVAPITTGQKLGVLTLIADGEKVGDWDLIAAKSVERAGFFRRIFQNINYMARRALGNG